MQLREVNPFYSHRYTILFIYFLNFYLDIAKIFVKSKTNNSFTNISSSINRLTPCLKPGSIGLFISFKTIGLDN